MNEIEKLYDNAGIKKKPYCELNCSITKNDFECTSYCLHYEDEGLYYPPFTAEKQLELIKWLARHNFVVCKNLGGWHTGINPTYDEDFGITCSKRATNLDSFEEALAGLTNQLWQDLTEEGKEQIRSVLNV